MFAKIFEWVKHNKLSTVLALILAYIFFGRSIVSPMMGISSTLNTSYDAGVPMMAEYAMDSVSMGAARSKSAIMPPVTESAPRPNVTDRKVITNSYLSLQVKSVRDTMGIIKASVEEMGGYMVERDLNTPEFGEDGSIAVRIPTEKLEETLERFRKLAVKVVSENISGSDITDQYMDIEERIKKLEATKTRFEEIYNKAVEIEDILRVQNEIFSLQNQIDSYKGQLTYFDAASSTTLIRIYLSTDELGLPYTPSQSWRPEAVFKQATRSLLENLIGIGNAGIWLVVYTPLILIALIIFGLIRKTVFKNK